MNQPFSFRDAYNEVGDALVGQVLPDGEYEIRVKTSRPDQTQGGKQCFKLTLEVLTPGPQKGKSIPDQLTWSPENDVAARIFAQSLRVLGAPMDWIQQNDPTPDQIADRLQDATAIVSLTADEWQGQPRNRVRYTRPTGLPRSGASIGGDSKAAAGAKGGGKAKDEAVSLGGGNGAGAGGETAVGLSDDPWSEFREPAADAPSWP